MLLRWLRFVTGILVAALVVSGCGGSDDDTAAKAPDDIATTVSAPPGQDVEGDRKLAENAVLKLDDMPSGWTAEPDSEEDEGEEVAETMAHCLDVPVETLTREGPADAESPTFNDPEEDFSVQSEVGYLVDTATAKERFDLFARDDVPGCLAGAVSKLIDDRIKNPRTPEDTLPEGAVVRDPKVAQMSFPNLADYTAAYRVSVPIEFRGLTFTLYLDLVVALKGRAGTTFFFTGNDTPFDTDEAQRYVKLVLDRMVST